MSTKGTIKYEMDATSGEGFHLYEEVFDDENVYLELQGFPFEAASSHMFPDPGKPRLVVRLSNGWAEKLGLIGAGTRTKQS